MEPIRYTERGVLQNLQHVFINNETNTMTLKDGKKREIATCKYEINQPYSFTDIEGIEIKNGKLIFYYDNNTQFIVGSIKGIQGPQGPTGPCGKVTIGTIGPTGPKGPQGPIGLPGMSITGPQGPRGIQGIMGQRGIQGLPGIQGPTGPTGPKGPVGDIHPYKPDFSSVRLQGDILSVNKSTILSEKSFVFTHYNNYNRSNFTLMKDHIYKIECIIQLDYRNRNINRLGYGIFCNQINEFLCTGYVYPVSNIETNASNQNYISTIVKFNNIMRLVLKFFSESDGDWILDNPNCIFNIYRIG